MRLFHDNSHDVAALQGGPTSNPPTVCHNCIKFQPIIDIIEILLSVFECRYFTKVLEVWSVLDNSVAYLLRSVSDRIFKVGQYLMKL